MLRCQGHAGIASGSVGDCGTGGHSYFQTVTDALAATGVDVY